MSQKMNFVPPPYPDDVEEDFGPYNRDEIVVARANLLHSMQRDNSMVWQNIKYKLGILPNGFRLRTLDPGHVWLPPQLPEIWSAPVALHDPTASSSSRKIGQSTKERDNRNERGEYEENKEEKRSTISGALTTRKEPCDSDAVRKSTSGRKTLPLTAASTSFASATVDGGEGSSKNAIWDRSNSELEVLDRQYEVVFQCDLCSFSSQEVGGIQCHLNEMNHYCASRYLALRQAHSGELRLLFLSVASLIKEPQHILKEKVAACPQCHSIFPSLHQCLSHTLENHQQAGQYSFRDVTQSTSFEMVKDICTCMDCDATFPDGDFPSHVKKTKHMSLYLGQKTSQPMMLFLCPFCQVIHSNFLEYKSHVFSKHKIPASETVTATCCMVGHSQPAQTVLPKDPGISLDRIAYDFNSPRIPGDPGFRGAITKSKLRRNKKSLQRLLSKSARIEKKKRKKATHKERLAAFKAARKEGRQNKKNKAMK